MTLEFATSTLKSAGSVASIRSASRGGTNFYAYGLNDPVNSTDPFGLEVQECLRPLHGPKPLNKYPHTLLYSTDTDTGFGLGPKSGWDLLTPLGKVPGIIE